MEGRFVWTLCWGVARKGVREAWGEEAGWWTESWEREQGEGEGERAGGGSWQALGKEGP